MSYVLTGPLAQIGRSGMVRDLVRRIGEAFAQNLDAQLHDPNAALPAAQLGGVSLIASVLADRLRALLGLLFGRRAPDCAPLTAPRRAPRLTSADQPRAGLRGRTRCCALCFVTYLFVDSPALRHFYACAVPLNRNYSM